MIRSKIINMPLDLANFPSDFQAASNHYAEFFMDVSEVRGIHRFPDRWRGARLQIDQYLIWRERLQKCQSFEELEMRLNSHLYAICNVPMVQILTNQLLVNERTDFHSFKFYEIQREEINHRIYHTYDNCLEEEIEGSGWVGSLSFKVYDYTKHLHRYLILGLSAYGIYVIDNPSSMGTYDKSTASRQYDLKFAILDRDFAIKNVEPQYQCNTIADDDFDDLDDLEDDWQYEQDVNYGQDY